MFVIMMFVFWSNCCTAVLKEQPLLKPCFLVSGWTSPFGFLLLLRAAFVFALLSCHYLGPQVLFHPIFLSLFF